MNDDIDLSLFNEMRENGLLSQEDYEQAIAEARRNEGASLETVADEITVEHDHTALAQEIEQQEHREAIYAEHGGGVLHESEITDLPQQSVVEATAKPEKAPRKPRAPKVEKPVKVATESVARKARINVGGTLGSYAASVAGERIALIEGSDVLTQSFIDSIPAKKVREKAVNICDHVFKGKTLSVFTQQAINMLRSEGKLDSKSLVTLYGSKYTIGTSRSQAQQIVTLLPMMKLANRVGSELLLNEAGLLWGRFAPQ